jgi:hypothetical protein
MRFATRLLMVGWMLLIPAVTNAAQGIVVFYKSGCDYYIVETNMGYSLLEWYGGNDPSEGDVLVGDYESYGMKTIYNVTANSGTKVWVEDFWLSKGNVIKKYFQNCK